MLATPLSQILRYSACQEEDDYDSRCDPEGPIEVGVALEDIKEVLARVYGAAAAVEDLIGVDVEELLVEGYAPEVAFRGGGPGGARGLLEEGGVVGLDLVGI